LALLRVIANSTWIWKVVINKFYTLFLLGSGI